MQFKPNHFASAKPTVVLLAMPDKEVQALVDEAGAVIVFKNHSKAKKHVANNLETHLWRYINYANENPIRNAGDRQETHNKRCLKCKSFLRPSHVQQKMTAPGMPSGILVEEYECPKCDLKED